MAFFTRALVLAQAVPPRRLSGGLDAFTRAILLDQVQARERNVELGRLGKLQHHVFTGNLALLNFLEPLIHADAVLHVDHKVAHGEVAEVRHEGRGLRLAAQRLGRLNLRIVKQIARAEDDQMRFRQGHAFRHGGANDGGGK